MPWFNLPKFWLLGSATRDRVWTTGMEVASGGRINRAWHITFDDLADSGAGAGFCDRHGIEQGLGIGV